MKSKKIKLLMVLLTIAALAVIFIAVIFPGIRDRESTVGTASLPAAASHAMGERRTYTFDQLAGMSTGYLLLVNYTHPTPAELTGNLVRAADRVAVSPVNPNVLILESALDALVEMFAYAASERNFMSFRVSEGFRTEERQRDLWDNAANQALVAYPGHSEHQMGLAADISYAGVNIGNSAQGSWLMANAYRFGFILRYPAHKTEITNVPFEPWHYRFVGQPHAFFMMRNDLVLEEYIQLLQREGALNINLVGIDYRIVHIPGGGYVEIPEGYVFTASLDNTGGVIVTMWRSS
ncbi:MAG: M15 family metallopeptidase [Defluviitaleaceae bacterium]|nr:M15 family metallopeptidase [Defluviitaleaceae bacterium]